VHVKRLAVLVMAVIAALPLAACGGGDDDAGQAATTVAFDIRPKSRAVEARFQVRADGKIALDYDETTEVQIVTFHAKKQEVSLLSVGVIGFRNLADGRQFRVAFDLAGSYRGDGKYSIKAKTSDAVHSGVDLSNVTFLVVDLKDPAAPQSAENIENAFKFDRPQESCTITVEGQASSGVVECKKLSDETGETVHLRMQWSATPEK
jgi:hypothetical protein